MTMKYLTSIFAAACTVLLPLAYASADVVRLDELDIASITQGYGKPGRNLSVGGHTLSIGGTKFEHGIGTHAAGEWIVDLHGGATKFSVKAGLDDEEPEPRASIRFRVYGDTKLLWETPVLKAGSGLQSCDVDLTGVRYLALIVDDAGDGMMFDHADWVDGKIDYTGAQPSTAVTEKEEAIILTPPALPSPRINGAGVFGVRPGSPILWTIPATGTKPIAFAVTGLPAGATLDGATGRISGTLKEPGIYKLKVTATNAVGQSQRDVKLVVGPGIALTPPMGWNSWNCFAWEVTAKDIEAATDAMVKSGLIDHGWTYINIDDFWQNSPSSHDKRLQGPARSADGTILANQRFPDMKGLADYVHGQGLRVGLYSSPGPLTCGGCYSSYKHEAQDAATYAAWGYDYLKYDWCSYGGVYDQLKKEGKVPSELDGFKAPYTLMGQAIASQKRDIVFSLCQYGMGDVWNWGAEVKGSCWRTTGDITDNWGSMAGIGFSQDKAAPLAGVSESGGHWNDPDMLVVGQVGWGKAHPTGLTPNEQYTHISLWSLLSAPLLIGCDMTKLDAFTLSLLTNDEVIDIDQDELGKSARQVVKHDFDQVWVKPLADGAWAVGIFNTGFMPRSITVNFADIGLPTNVAVRDVWRQKDLGPQDDKLTAEVPRHGCLLVKVTRR